MQSKSAMILAAVLAPAILFDLGCGPASGDRPALPRKPFDGVVLRVACPDAATAAAVAQYGGGWANRCGVRLAAGVYDRAASPPDADVWVLEAAELPRLAAAGKLAPLPATVRDAPAVAWGGLLPVYREHLLVWDRTTCAVPLLGDALVCLYRKDLLEKAENRAAFFQKHGRTLEAPATWEDFADIAEFFSRSRGEAGPCLPPLPADALELERLFYAVATPFARRAVWEDAPNQKIPDEDLFAFHFDLATGAPRVAQPGFAHALALLQRLQAFRPTRPDMQPWQAFRKGEAVLCLTSVHHLGTLQEKGSPVRDHFGICPVPGSRIFFDYKTGGRRKPPPGHVNRVAYLGAGARLVAVPRASQHSEAAFALLAELGSRSTAAQIVLEPRWGGGPVRQDHLDREHWDALQLEPETARALKNVLRQTFESGVRNPVLGLRVPDERDFAVALTAAVRKTLASAKGGEDADRRAARALEGVARRWQELVKPRAAEHLREYRLSLGLEAPR